MSVLSHGKYVVISLRYFSGSKEKLKMIDEIRRKDQTTTRNITKKNHFLVCPHCKGFYSKTSTRTHFLKRSPEVQKFGKNLPFLSRVTYGQVHKKQVSL